MLDPGIDRIRVLNPQGARRQEAVSAEIVDSIQECRPQAAHQGNPDLNGSQTARPNTGWSTARAGSRRFIALGQKAIPAIVADLSEEDSLLIEPGRECRPPSPPVLSELLPSRSATSSASADYTDRQIAAQDRISRRHSRARTIRRLLKGGEERAPHRGRDGQDAAQRWRWTIAAADDEHVQKDILAEAYEKRSPVRQAVDRAPSVQVERRLAVSERPICRFRPNAAGNRTSSSVADTLARRLKEPGQAARSA